MSRTADALGPQEIAVLLGVKVATVHTWRHRGIMPAEVMRVSGVPLWDEAEIKAWARSTGRLT